MFKTPLAKLSKFFQRSRDSWKAKCHQLKRENKKLANQTRAVEKSRESWREVATSARQRVVELEQELKALKTLAAAEYN